MNIQDIATQLELEVEDIMELLDLLFAMSEGEFGRIFSALKQNDMQTVAESAHSLKGAVGNLRLVELWEKARSLEMAARQGEGDRAEKLALEMQADLSALKKEVAP